MSRAIGGIGPGAWNVRAEVERRDRRQRARVNRTARELEAAQEANGALLVAYALGELRGGSVEWEELNQAFNLAQAASPGRYEALRDELRAALVEEEEEEERRAA
jgi:hypothetical protein